MNNPAIKSYRKLICAIVLVCMTLLAATLSATTGLLNKRAHIDNLIPSQLTGVEYLGQEGVVRQQTKYDCGIACLQMVLERKGGIKVIAEKLRAEAGMLSNGTSLWGLKQAAEANGLKASTWQLSISDLSQIPLPAIAFVGGNHFVVIEQVEQDGHLIILDPGYGRLRYEASTFEPLWRGEILVLDREQGKWSRPLQVN